jgi:hypothetical protein
VKQKVLCGVLLCLWICSTAAVGYEGKGFTVEIPEEWGACQTDGATWLWNFSDEWNMTVFVTENSDQGNYFDLGDGDLEDLNQEIIDGLESGLRESFADMGITCNPKVTSSTSQLTQWGDGQPAVVMDFVVDAADENGVSLTTFYEHMITMASQELVYSFGYSAADPQALEDAVATGVAESFRMTGKCFDGPTEEPTIWEVLFSGSTLKAALRGGLIGAAVAGAAGGIRTCLNRRKKRKAEEKTSLEP